MHVEHVPGGAWRPVRSRRSQQGTSGSAVGCRDSEWQADEFVLSGIELGEVQALDDGHTRAEQGSMHFGAAYREIVDSYRQRVELGQIRCGIFRESHEVADE